MTKAGNGGRVTLEIQDPQAFIGTFPPRRPLTDVEIDQDQILAETTEIVALQAEPNGVFDTATAVGSWRMLQQSWTEEESRLLKEGIQRYGTNDCNLLAQHIGTRNCVEVCMAVEAQNLTDSTITKSMHRSATASSLAAHVAFCCEKGAQAEQEVLNQFITEEQVVFGVSPEEKAKKLEQMRAALPIEIADDSSSEEEDIEDDEDLASDADKPNVDHPVVGPKEKNGGPSRKQVSMYRNGITIQVRSQTLRSLLPRPASGSWRARLLLDGPLSPQQKSSVSRSLVSYTARLIEALHAVRLAQRNNYVNLRKDTGMPAHTVQSLVRLMKRRAVICRQDMHGERMHAPSTAMMRSIPITYTVAEDDRARREKLEESQVEDDSSESSSSSSSSAPDVDINDSNVTL